MKITKVLNNNVVVANDQNGEEIVLMDRGLSFGKKAGDDVEEQRVEKKFHLQNEQLADKFQQLMANIPLAHFLLAERVINYAKVTLGRPLSDSIFVTLPDHISGAIMRYKEGIVLPNPLLWDIKRFYPDEYAVGKKANDVVREETGISFTEDEAGFIALHFVNAQQSNGDVRDVYDMTELMQHACEIIQRETGCSPDRDSLNFYRFVTHLRFFAQRIMNGQQYGDDEADLLEVVKYKYPKAYVCAQQVCDYVKKTKGFDAGQNELFYLTVHIARITGDPTKDE